MANGADSFQDWFSNSGWGSLVLAQVPQAAYYSAPRGLEFAQQSPRQGRYFQQAYQDVYSDYLGDIGRSLRKGQEPTTFQAFLETNPWTTRYGQLPQSARGVTGAAYNPRTRFLFNY
jgi:hypothetical protein